MQNNTEMKGTSSIGYYVLAQLSDAQKAIWPHLVSMLREDFARLVSDKMQVPGLVSVNVGTR